MTSYHILQTEVTLNILPYLGYPDLLRSYCRLTKKTLQIFLDYFICHKDVEEVNGGTLQGDSREILSSTLHRARDVVHEMGLAGISPQAELAVQLSGGDLGILRKSQRSLLEYFQININVYKYWERTPDDPHKGIFHCLLADIESDETERAFRYKEFMEDCPYWNSSKVFGDFIVLMERRDGSILVSADYSKVYLVLGHLDSLAGKITFIPGKGFSYVEKYPAPKIHGPINGVKVKMILLNWQNKVAYDGMMSPREMVSKAALKKALQAYLQALNRGTLITSLPKKESVTAHVQPCKVDKEEYESYRLKYLLELQSIGSRPSPKEFDINSPLELSSLRKHYLVYRSCGCKDEECVSHIIAALRGEECVSVVIMGSLTPTIGEYIQLTLNYCNNEGRKPAVIAIDYIPHFEMFQRLMKDLHIHVRYYSLPSDVDHFFDNLASNWLDGARCKVCGKALAFDGTALMQCSQCKNVHYCSKEHQKQDWKSHKKYCIIHK
eukprot:gene14463-16008_t